MGKQAKIRAERSRVRKLVRKGGIREAIMEMHPKAYEALLRLYWETEML